MRPSVPLLDPRRDLPHRMPRRVRPHFRDRIEAREPLEVAAGRENGVGTAGVDLREDFGRARPAGAHRLMLADRRLGRACWRLGEEEQGIEPPRLREIGAPAGERRERDAVDGEAMGGEQFRRQMIVGIDPAARDIRILNALFANQKNTTGLVALSKLIRAAGCFC
jgi:hypothetical protein